MDHEPSVRRMIIAPELPSLVPGDLVTWEVRYDDGTYLRERMGARYAEIDRDRFAAFSLVQPGELLFEISPPDGASGHNFMYRRRTEASTDGSRRVIFLIAFAPMGPCVMIDPANGTYRVEAAFIEGDVDMYPPTPQPGDGKFLLDNLAPSQ